MMMMIMGRESPHSNPTVHIPPWDDDLTDHHNLNTNPLSFDEQLEMSEEDMFLFGGEYDDDVSLQEAFSCDHFRMYEFKIRRCSRGRSHDWTECPYAHSGEKARRRDPRKFHYSGNPCPEFRTGTCQKGDTCEYAHGVFECWLHPSRYRTQPCKDGVACRRRICFFAHTPEQLRILSQLGSTHPESYDGSPSRLGLSPTSTLYTSPYSPPMSPVSSMGCVNELTSSLRNMQINGTRLSMSGSPRSLSILRPGFVSLPTTPTRNPTRSGVNGFDIWETRTTEEEPMMERVESGKDIRAKMYAKLSRDNSLVGRVDSSSNGGWVGY